MTSKPTYDEILSLVEKPSRYLGTEANSIKKDPERVKLRFALAYPDLYEIGTSHFGMQILYHVLNERREIAAERVFAPAVDMEGRLREARLPLSSLETRRPLSRFDIVGFSLLYELNYTNVLTMLDLAGIPFRADHRQADQPMVIAGGPCTCNPEPVAELFDAMVLGDGEEVVLKMADAWMAWKETDNPGKTDLLERWAQISGVYVPAFYRFRIDGDGFSRVEPDRTGRRPASRAVIPDLEKAPFPDRPVIPFGRPVHDRLRLEVSRGCTRGCRFCQAGMIYRPVRERSCNTLLALAAASLNATGYEDLSLLSLSTGDHSGLDTLLQQLMQRCRRQHVAVSLPSFRAGSLTGKMMEEIKQVRKTGFTIAPEAGSQRLRNVVNKNLTDEEIEQTVFNAFSLGWQVVKLYFMIGLPTETELDHESIVDLVMRLRALRKKSGRRGQVNVSLTTFIPKPHTPFQWAQQLRLSRSEQIIARLRDRLSKPGVQVKWQDPRVSILEGLWARGDRRLLPLLVTAWKKGCRFDGWSDHFRFDRWREAMEETGVDIDFFTTRRRTLDEPLPWDHIDINVSREFLQEEYQRAMGGTSTPDCRWGDCNDCGACDFERLAPVVGGKYEPIETNAEKSDDSGRGRHRIRIDYAKTGDARHFGHLEMVSIFIRAMRRAGLSINYSEGFHPKPRLVLGDPLPVGMESEKETLDVRLEGDLRISEAVAAIDKELPPGLRILGARRVPEKAPLRKRAVSVYRVSLSEGGFDKDRLEAFESASEWTVTRRTAKGKLKKINLKDMIIKISISTPAIVELALRSEPACTVRPAEVLEHVFELEAEQIRKARVIKKEKEPDSGTAHV